jgi:hypothetical protein
MLMSWRVFDPIAFPETVTRGEFFGLCTRPLVAKDAGHRTIL